MFCLTSAPKLKFRSVAQLLIYISEPSFLAEFPPSLQALRYMHILSFQRRCLNTSFLLLNRDLHINTLLYSIGSAYPIQLIANASKCVTSIPSSCLIISSTLYLSQDLTACQFFKITHWIHPWVNTHPCLKEAIKVYGLIIAPWSGLQQVTLGKGGSGDDSRQYCMIAANKQTKRNKKLWSDSQTNKQTKRKKQTNKRNKKLWSDYYPLVKSLLERVVMVMILGNNVWV